MTMKIENYEGVANTFTWPNNPRSFDATTDANFTIINHPYQVKHTFTSGGGISPKSLVLTGHLFGASKDTNFLILTKNFQENKKLKKLYFDSDRFHLGFGKQIKKTQTGGRTNFIDYVGTFQTIINILFGDTKRTSGTNAGNIPTFVESIVGTITDGAVDVTLSDNHGLTITVPNSELTTSQDFRIDLIRLLDSGSGIFFTKFNYVGLGVDTGTTTSASAYKLVQTGQNFDSTVSEKDLIHNTTDNTFAFVTNVDSATTLSLDQDIMDNSEAFVIYSQSGKVNISPVSGLLTLDVGENMSAITTTNLSSVTTSFRDGYSS